MINFAITSFIPIIVGIGGTSRPNSTSERAVAEGLRVAEGLGARTRMFNGSFGSNLPLYAPDRRERTGTLRLIAHALRAWPTPFGAAPNASTPLFETDGTCIDSKIADQLCIIATQVVEFAHHRAAGLAIRKCV
jgi:hypothetical protein